MGDASASKPTQFSIVLITPAVLGLRESGTGFVIGRTGTTAFVATCSHVIRDWTEGVHVNGRKAEILNDGGKDGIDVAILKVSGVDAAPLKLKDFAREGTAYYGFGFRHLHGDDYVRSRFRGNVKELLSLQGRSASTGLAAWEIRTNLGCEIAPGNSGSPIIETKTDRVVGIVSHAIPKNGQRDGRAGIAISPVALRLLWPSLGQHDEPWSVVDLQTAEEADLVDASERPPSPPEPTSENDVQLGRFGRKARRNGLQLEALLTDTKNENYFYVDFVVRSTDKSKLVGPAFFYLHDTYPKQVIRIKKPDNDRVIALRDVYSYGVYTVGCQVRRADGTWVALELNLASIPGMPRRFLER